MNTRNCACGQEFAVHPSERNPRRWCSEACRVRHQRRPEVDRQATVRRNERLRARRAEAGVQGNGKSCEVCGAVLFGRQLVTCSRTCRNQRLRQSGAFKDARQRYRATDKGRACQDRRRARKREAFVAEVNRTEIFARDNWTCLLCGQPVDRRVVAPELLAPTLDHIIPLARGGTHEPENVQCAHFICNSRKGSRTPTPELRSQLTQVVTDLRAAGSSSKRAQAACLVTQEVN